MTLVMTPKTSQAAAPGQLPDNAFYGDDGELYHRVERMTEGGTKVEVVRPLATNLAEARDKHLDFYHPTLGLRWEGYKLASDRTPESIMKDASVGGRIPAGERPPTFS